MCQVDEEYSGQLEARPSMPCVSQKCVKCKRNQAVLIIRAGDAFCGGCFKDYFVHKFRAMLGKNRLIFPGEKVLLAVSGGPASSAMLAQVQQGLSQDAPKKLRFIPGVVYVDEGGACSQSLEQRQAAIGQLESIFRITGYPFHIVYLEQVFSLPSSVLEAAIAGPLGSVSDYKVAVDRFMQNQYQDPVVPETQCRQSWLDSQDPSDLKLPFTPQHSQALDKLFGSVRTLTARQDLLQTLRQHLIMYTARTRGYSKVMMGDSCSRLAVKLLGNIALGRGASLAMDTGFSDPRYGDVVIVRPMREYSSKEIGFYNRMFRVPTVFLPGLDTKAPDKASVQRLTESFVTRLQADFPSTVSTIYRTSEKLHMAGPLLKTDTLPSDQCLLCMCPLDTKVEEASAFHATLVSERLSQKGAPASPSGRPASVGQCCSSGGEQAEGCCTDRAVDRTLRIPGLLCYSCRLTLRDMTDVDSLPRYVISEAERRERRCQMKEEISEFLLDDGEETS